MIIKRTDLMYILESIYSDYIVLDIAEVAKKHNYDLKIKNGVAMFQEPTLEQKYKLLKELQKEGIEQKNNNGTIDNKIKLKIKEILNELIYISEFDLKYDPTEIEETIYDDDLE